MKPRPLALAFVVVLALALVGAAAARPTARRATVVKVTARDFSFILSTKTVPHGRVTFEINNTGRAVHDFEIAGHTSSSVGPGKATTMAVTLKRGSHPYKCTIDAHAQLGMKGVLHVT